MTTRRLNNDTFIIRHLNAAVTLIIDVLLSRDAAFSANVQATNCAVRILPAWPANKK